MTDGNTQAIAQYLDERDEWDALQEVTVELEQAEARIEELEARLARAVEVLDRIDEVVLVRLRSSRETCVEMRLLLDADRGTDHLTDVEMEDWQSLVLDIAALDRVIDYYGG